MFLLIYFILIQYNNNCFCYNNVGCFEIKKIKILICGILVLFCYCCVDASEWVVTIDDED